MTTYKIIKNTKYGDFRVEQYVDGEWVNSFDDNWTRPQAIEVARYLRASGGLEYFTL